MGNSIKWFNSARPFCYPRDLAGANDDTPGLEGGKIYFTGPWLLAYWAKYLVVVPDQADTRRTRKDERKVPARNVVLTMRNPTPPRGKDPNPRQIKPRGVPRSASPVRRRFVQYRDPREPLVKEGEKGKEKAKECKRCERLVWECDGKDPCSECMPDFQGDLCQFQTTDNTFALDDDIGDMYDLSKDITPTPCGRCIYLKMADHCDGREPCNQCWAAELVCYPQGT